jgi:uncharacterized glyoxalase superfamily protein PhnB/ribosomal protein S18 acetylase RimI-like enzyme
MIPRLPGAVPEIPVANLAAALEYYRDTLGFTVDWVADDIALAGLSRDACRLFLAGPAFTHRAGNAAPLVTWLNLESPEEVDALHHVWHRAGADVLSPPESKPWGLREFTVTDPDGNRFRVFHDVATPARERAERESLATLSRDLVSIRLATEGDWPRIWPLFSRVVSTGDTYTVPPETTEAEGRAYWVDRALAVYVAEADDKVVGTYCLRVNLPGLGSHSANAGYMVSPALAGRGIGSRMCQHSLVEARNMGFEAMQFNAVVSTNHRAVALWKRHGFEIIGTVPRGFRHRRLGPVDLYVMHRFL